MLKPIAKAIPPLLAAPALMLAQALPDNPYGSVEEALAAMDKPLYSKCEPVNLVVNANLRSVDSDTNRTLEEALRHRAETALRAGSIWTDERRPGPTLGISANQGGSPEVPLNAVFISVRLVKPATDDYGTRFLATAWIGHQSAVPFDKFNVALDVLNQSIDEFVIKYLKVNSAACAGTQ